MALATVRNCSSTDGGVDPLCPPQPLHQFGNICEPLLLQRVIGHQAAQRALFRIEQSCALGCRLQERVIAAQRKMR